MKKTHWLRTTIITLAACGLAGLILAVVLFNANPGRTGVSSTIEFSFDGASDGLAPNGSRFDLEELTSDDVLNAALGEAGMADRYTAEQLRENILVTGVYPKNIVEQMTGYESLLTGDAGKVKFTDYHATLYSVTLYNDFDKGISRADLEKLLTAVMGQFRARFIRVYSVILSDEILDMDLSKYDYSQQLDLMDRTLIRLHDFAAEMAEKHPDFRLNGQGFEDIAVRYENLRTTELNRLSGIVSMNALSTNPDRIAAQYENRVRVLEIRIAELTREAKDTDELIAQYTKDGIIYVSTSGALQQVGSNTSETYDALIARRQELENQIADLNRELAEVKLKLSDLRGSAGSETAAPAEDAGEEEKDETAVKADPSVPAVDPEAGKTLVENGVASIAARREAITADFTAALQAYSEREMNEQTIAVTPVLYSAPKILSGAFIKHALKTAGPLCALGFMACLVGIIISRRKEK